MAEQPTALDVPATVDEGRQLLSRGLRVPPEEIPSLYGLSDERLDEVIRAAIKASWTGEEFLSKAVQELAGLQRSWDFERSPWFVFGKTAEAARIAGELAHGKDDQSPTTVGASPVATQTEDPTALVREVSGLRAKVNILLAVTGGSALAIIAGAIGLWQTIGNVETRLTRELGQVETRITQQIADVRSEVGEIRGRLSVLGQAGPTPPRQ